MLLIIKCATLALVIALGLFVASTGLIAKECKDTEKGWEYKGKIRFTQKRVKCLNWEDASRNLDIKDDDFPERSVVDAKNYCRNPGRRQAKGPYCYTSLSKDAWDYCDVPFCSKPNHCLGHPCQNNGSCYQNINSGLPYRCACAPNWTGQNCNCKDGEACETATVNCTLPCEYGGTCSWDGFQQHCVCPNYHEGTLCQYRVDRCRGVWPSYHGWCVSEDGQKHVNCSEPFSGSLCELGKPDVCSPNPCMNNGTCVDQLLKYQCLCVSGFTGTNCSVNVDVCVLYKPCSERTQCKNIPGGHRCDCRPGFVRNVTDNFNDFSCTHTICDETCADVNECQTGNNTCPVNSTCHNTIGSYQCICHNGFKLETRDNETVCVDIDECVTSMFELSTCSQNSNCTNTFGSFSCTCLPGFEGQQCFYK